MKKKSKTAINRTLTLLLFFFLMLVLPLAASAQTFENPVPGLTPEKLIKNTINFLLGLMGIIALLGIVYGGLTIILGSMRSEQDIKRGKEILFWSIAGLMIVGVAAIILRIIKGILF